MDPVRQRVDKAFAYVVRNHELLAFRHRQVPSAGIQVPAGTVRVEETPEEAVLREAFEETGLAGLAIRRFLGAAEYDVLPFGRDEIHVRHFFHLDAPIGAPDEWSHPELHDGLRPPTWFEFFWIDLASADRVLHAGHGGMIDRLRFD